MQKSAALFIPDRTTLTEVFKKDTTFADPHQNAIDTDMQAGDAEEIRKKREKDAAEKQKGRGNR